MNSEAELQSEWAGMYAAGVGPGVPGNRRAGCYAGSQPMLHAAAPRETKAPSSDENP